jgi:hypothetical protein
MVAKDILIARILAEHFQRFVAAMLLHLEQIRALTPRLGQESARRLCLANITGPMI